MKILKSIFLFLIIFVGLSNDVTIAQCSPTLREIYDFEVGDQFYYRETRRTDDVRSYYSYFYESYEIVSKHISNDTIRYERLNHENKLDTLLIIDSVNHPLNQCNGSRFSISSDCIYPDTNQALAHITRDSNNRKYKLYGYGNFANNSEIDSQGYYPFDLQYFKYESFECYAIYAEGLGLYANGTFFFEKGRFYDLQKFIRGSDTLSIKLDNRAPVAQTNLKIYPNPVTNHCTIESQGSIKHIVVSNLSGQLLTKTIVEKPTTNIGLNTSTFEHGVYYLTIETEHGSFIKKLLKY